MSKITNRVTEKALTNISLKYSNDAMNFISDKISPRVNVILRNATIYSYGTDNLRITNSFRAIGGGSHEVQTSVSKATHYTLADHALYQCIPYEDYENAEKPLNVQIDETENLTEMLMVAKEFALAAAVQDTSVMTSNTTLSGTDQWSDYVNGSDPIEDILDGIKAIKAATAKLANTLILSYDVYLTLLYHPDILDMYPGASAITADMLTAGIGRIFPHITEVEVGMAMYNSANKNASLSLTEIWTKTAVVAYIEQKPKLKSRTLSYTYQKGKQRTVQFVKKNATNHILVDRNADFLRVNDEYDQVLVDVECGYLIDNAIA